MPFMGDDHSPMSDRVCFWSVVIQNVGPFGPIPWVHDVADHDSTRTLCGVLRSREESFERGQVLGLERCRACLAISAEILEIAHPRVGR